MEPNETKTEGTEQVVTETKTDTTVQDEGTQETEKPTETLEARRARLTRELKQVSKKLGIEDEKPAKKQKQSGELDWGQKAYLKASGIEPTYFGFVQQELEDSGHDLETLLESGYFKSRLETEKGNNDALKAASIKGTRTSTEPATSKVEYWIAKGKLPDDPELRIQVVNRKIEIERSARGRY
jgi:hypothetical protein